MIAEAEEILRKLPELMHRDPDFKYRVFGIISEEFSRKIDLDKLYEQNQALLEELRELREDSNRRFEASEKRFEAMDKRFEAMQRQMDERFRAVDKRFDGMQESFENLKSWVGTVVGGFQRRAGQSLEDAIAGTLRIALGYRDIKPENIRMRQKFVDTDGEIGPKGREYEIDIYVSDSKYIFFEIASSKDMGGC